MEEEIITMLHGAGGAITHKLIVEHILKFLGGGRFDVPLEALDDAAVVNGIVIKSDSHAVKPLFFPGGDIGRLAVAGTVNDIAVIGAEPIALTLGFILEEGLPLKDLDRILESMKTTCEEAGVKIVTGDTKVVEKGVLGGCVINTSGIGFRMEGLDRNISEIKRYRSFRENWLLDSNLQVGDKIILSGTIGDHGIAILSSRYGYDFGYQIKSDVTPLNRMVKSLLEVGGIIAMKDLTRGGLANALNEWREKSEVGITIQEDKIPVKEGVRAACEMLGMDPLEIGNEGKIIIGVVPEKADDVLKEVKRHPEGKDAEIIGEVTDKYRKVLLETIVGGERYVGKPLGDPIPRIC